MLTTGYPSSDRPAIEGRPSDDARKELYVCMLALTVACSDAAGLMCVGHPSLQVPWWGEANGVCGAQRGQLRPLVCVTVCALT